MRLPLLFLLLFLAGCGRSVERIAERKVSELLPGVIGPADKYASRVRGSASALRAGRLRSVHIEGVNVRLTDDLTVDLLTLDLGDVHVDTRAGVLERVGSAVFRARLGEANLNRYARARRPGIAGLRLSLRNGNVVAQARPELFGVPIVPIEVAGSVVPRPGGRELDFVPGGARVSVLSVPAPVLRFIAENLNPVVDLSTVRVPIRVETATVEGDVALVLAGSVAPGDLVQASRSGR